MKTGYDWCVIQGTGIATVEFTLEELVITGQDMTYKAIFSQADSAYGGVQVEGSGEDQVTFSRLQEDTIQVDTRSAPGAVRLGELLRDGPERPDRAWGDCVGGNRDGGAGAHSCRAAPVCAQPAGPGRRGGGSGGCSCLRPPLAAQAPGGGACLPGAGGRGAPGAGGSRDPGGRTPVSVD